VAPDEDQRAIGGLRGDERRIQSFSLTQGPKRDESTSPRRKATIISCSHCLTEFDHRRECTGVAPKRGRSPNRL
jgi:hypothetical protein